MFARATAPGTTGAGGAIGVDEGGVERRDEASGRRRGANWSIWRLKGFLSQKQKKHCSNLAPTHYVIAINIFVVIVRPISWVSSLFQLTANTVPINTSSAYSNQPITPLLFPPSSESLGLAGSLTFPSPPLQTPQCKTTLINWAIELNYDLFVCPLLNPKG